MVHVELNISWMEPTGGCFFRKLPGGVARQNEEHQVLRAEKISLKNTKIWQLLDLIILNTDHCKPGRFLW